MKPLKLGGYRTAQPIMLDKGQIALARSNARRHAVELLQDKIAGLRLRSGLTVGKYIKNKENIRSAIEKLCRLAPIERVEITDGGLVKLHLSILTRTLPGDLQRVLGYRTPAAISAIGGGLPRAVKKPETTTEKKDADK